MINVTKTHLPKIDKYEKYLKKIWQSHWVTNDGVLSQDLEISLIKFLGIKNLSLVNNATSGLLIALKALDLKGEVITTPFTFVATLNSILWLGLKPKFVDIDPDTFNIDVNKIESKITNKTSAILAVHVYGNPCNVDDLARIAKKHNLKLIYDAAHSFNVKYKNKSVLNYGDISILSFHATKTFHTIEGGAIISKSRYLTNKFKLLRNFGIVSEEKIVIPGINAKMNEFQAAMGLVNLESINSNIAKRKKIYEYYKSNIKNVKFQKLIASSYNYSYMPVVFSNKKKRDRVYKVLLKNHIKSRKYFFPLVSDLPFSNPYKNVDLTNARNISDGVLCLPIYPEMKRDDLKAIIKIVNEVNK